MMIDLTNYDDLIASERGWLSPDKVRRIRIQASVDRTSSFALPKDIVEKLGLRIVEPKVLCSDGMKLKALIHPAEEGATFDETVANIREAAEGWLEVAAERAN